VATPLKIRVMISSRCNDPIEFNGTPSTLSAVRVGMKKELEEFQLFASALFDVWINEDAAPAEGTADAWDECLKQVREADIVLVLYNGNAGWAKESGDVGICHAELQTALSTGAAKIRLIQLPSQPLGEGATRARNERFRAYANSQSLFRGAEAETGEEAIERCIQALREAIPAMVRLGVREARRGKYYTGDALAWHRLDYRRRRQAMEDALRGALLGRQGAEELTGNRVAVRIAGKMVLIICHGVPDALSIPAALEPIGQPFLADHEHVPFLDGGRIGPVHLFACQQGVTGSQARRLLGYPDVTNIQAPFGVYLADRVQKIQLVFITQCRDETSTRHGAQRFFDWLEQSQEREPLAERAAARKRIAKAIAKEQQGKQSTSP
jgi:hypothetical protein